RPLLPLWRTETETYCRANGLAFRTDSSNPHTVRGLIRSELLPILRRIHVAADMNVLRALEERRELPAPLAELIDSRAGSKRGDEHTSELQSLAYLVCRLLLEKKK